jgi:hypothetical protein
MMAKNYERDEREEYSRRQNRGPQQRWYRGGQDEDYDWNMQGQEGRDDWRRNEDYERGRWRDMAGRERFAGSGMGYGQHREQRKWEGRDWEGEYGNQGDYGRRDWDERSGRMGRMEREGQEPWGWNQRNQWNQGNQWNQWGNRGRMEGQFAGYGPRSYKRSDDRIEEDINDRLTQHSMIDATDIEVSVQNGEVTLRGHVDHRETKRMAEEIAESVFGVKDVNNQIKIKQRGEGEEGKHETETSGKRERKVS